MRRDDGWQVEYTSEFEAWWDTLEAATQDAIDSWYERFIPLADKPYDAHLAQLREEGSINGT